ncbi:MAG: hypothetical protein VKK42_22860 [Lyngbya sp.]|nr:hypothetical protein [Lyngbya sp.]
MLSDVDIRQAREAYKNGSNTGISIEPFDEDHLTPVGYDLRVGYKGFSWRKRNVINIREQGTFKIEPDDTVVIETLESVILSPEVGATVHSLVSKVVPEGLSNISTTIDPGWKGKLLISVHNYSDTPTVIEYEKKICTVCFFEVKSNAVKNPTREIDREDLWRILLAKADKAGEKLEKERKYRFLLMIIYVIASLIIGGLTARIDPAFGATIAALIAGISPLVVEIIRNPK